MKIEQIYTGCLAQGAYYIESGGEAAIVDPLREVAPYIEKARQRGVRIRYVLETHFHADFVSGHVDLSQKTGAAIVYGPTARPDFPHHSAADGELLPLGNITIQVLHTPGHTMESTCYLVHDEQGKPQALLSGDTLFIGDVGRPDLAQKIKAELTQELLAGHLYDSLRNKIMPLADDIVVYPAHGAGSACGKNMSRETSDTLGHQKKTNYALRPDMTREAFIREVTAGLTKPPAYFPANVMMNIHGYESMDTVLKRGLTGLTPAAFEAKASETGALMLDVRDAASFAKGFIPNAINIGLDGGFAPWAGALIPDIQQPILLIVEPGREQEAITRLSRVGLDHVIGYLEGGFASWTGATDRIPVVDARELAVALRKYPGAKLLDVRKQSEYNSEHIIGAENMPLDYINDAVIDRHQQYYVHCAAGYRSMIFISILRARGFDNLINVSGGFGALKEEGCFNVSGYMRSSTQL